MTKIVTVTKSVRRLVEADKAFTVTVVAEPRPYEPPDDDRAYLPEFGVDRENVLEFDRIRLVTYD